MEPRTCVEKKEKWASLFYFTGHALLDSAAAPKPYEDL